MRSVVHIFLSPQISLKLTLAAMAAMLLILLSPQSRAADAAPAEGVGDAAAGEQKSVVCQACHGADGNGISPEFPNLAGQVPGHIADQLASFKSTDPASRNNAVMLGMVAALSEQDMADLDAYYSSLEPKAGFVTEADVEQARVGEKIFRGGYRDLEIPACMSCHGPAGEGVPSQFPRVAGQQTKYLEMQLQAFKSGERQHAMMNPIAFKLSADQMRSLALFMQGLN